ncbi:MAG: hypothetical protein LC687_02515, partial [Actinobacteria bacterium]|nr:hypothetical protein [Actinomycetota bacterium]
MPYVGHRAVLPAQNSNEWTHNVKDKVGVYSNWSLQSSTHLLEDVGDAALSDYPQYAQGRHLSQVFKGTFTYKPMELKKFSHGGQDAPYLRHAYWEFHGVAGSEAFPRYVPATPAVVETGAITLADWSDKTGTGGDDDSFSFTVNITTVSIDGDYTSSDMQTLVDDMHLGVGFGVIASVSDDGDRIVFTSEDTGADAVITTTAATEIDLAAVTVNGADAEGVQWGYTVEDAKTRNFTFSRHSNWHFYGVPSTDATFDGRTAMEWDDPHLPSYARRHAPFVYKGVGDDVV